MTINEHNEGGGRRIHLNSTHPQEGNIVSILCFHFGISISSPNYFVVLSFACCSSHENAAARKGLSSDLNFSLHCPHFDWLVPPLAAKHLTGEEVSFFLSLLYNTISIRRDLFSFCFLPFFFWWVLCVFRPSDLSFPLLLHPK